jgi:hypothetical protein
MAGQHGVSRDWNVNTVRTAEMLRGKKLDISHFNDMARLGGGVEEKKSIPVTGRGDL